MFKFIPRNATTRAQSKNANLIIKNDDCDEDDEEGTDTLRKITRENNHIYYHAEVDRGSIFEMIELLRKCELDNIINAHKMCIDDIPIYLHINSFGGSIFDALTGIDAIQSCKVPVYTIIEGSKRRRMCVDLSFMLLLFVENNNNAHQCTSNAHQKQQCT